MRPLAPIVSELKVSGAGGLAAGLLGLAATLARRPDEPLRVVLPFLVVAFAVGAATTIASSRWLRRTVPDAPEAPPAAVDEDPARMRRRLALAVLVLLALIAVFVALAPGLAAVLAGAAAGSGGTDLRARTWLAGEERARGVRIMRVSAWSPFAGARRQVFTRPA